MTRRTRVLLACVLLVGTGGCSDPLGLDTHKQALDRATTDARKNATKTLDQLRTNLRTRTLEDALNDTLINNPYHNTTVLNSSTGPSNSFVADLVILGNGDAGGGLDYKQIAVRLCVRYSGKLGAGSYVDMANVACPAGLPSTDRGVPIERAVTVK